MSIEIIGINKKFGDFVALKDINLTVPSGELVALLGQSGCGKTTLLRIIAGLESPDAGSIVFDGVNTTERHVRERKVGFVFQHYALFRHYTVFENVAFGLKVKPRKVRPSKEEIREKVFELLRLVQLDYLADRYPSQLSGGQRQRVGLARVLAVEPRVLLLDEPFGALDARIRVELRRWLRRLHDTMHMTSVFVTHDQEEALEVADRVVVMNEGKIEQVGTPRDVYDHPANPFVYNFLGNVNIFNGRVHKGTAIFGDMEMAAPEHAAAFNRPAVGYVRPHDIEIERTPANESAIKAEVGRIYSIGPFVRVELILSESGETVEAQLQRESADRLDLKSGESVYARPRIITIYDDDYQI